MDESDLSRWRSRFAPVGSIHPDASATWLGRLFLTIDVDWASDRVLEHTVELVEAADVAATFFVTHDTPVLARIRANPRFELGIHPNFNPLLTGSPAGPRDMREVVANLMAIVPEARSVRSHSMTQSSRILDLFVEAGLTHDCNHFVPAQSGIALKPFRHWNGMIRVPYFWEDDVELAYGAMASMGELCRRSHSELCVFDFHPIHLALNTTSLEHYERSRASHHDWGLLGSHIATSYGVRDRLLELLAGDKSDSSI